MADTKNGTSAGPDNQNGYGLSARALKFLTMIDRFHRVSEAVLGSDGREKLHWQIIAELIINDYHGRHTVTKNVVDSTGRANATVRTVLDSYERHGLIFEVQRVGRSILYSPTPKLLSLLNEVGDEMYGECRDLFRGAERLPPQNPPDVPPSAGS